MSLGELLDRDFAATVQAIDDLLRALDQEATRIDGQGLPIVGEGERARMRLVVMEWLATNRHTP